jgi:hypothetical protein
VDINSISADGTGRVAVPVLVRVYAFVADCTPRPAVAVAIGVDVLTANPASRCFGCYRRQYLSYSQIDPCEGYFGRRTEESISPRPAK